MLLKTEAIVIKTIRYSESSIITRLFTRSHGILSFYVKGVYSPKAAFKPSFFMPLQVLDIDFYFHPNKNLLSLKEIKPDKNFSNILFEKEKSPVALMIAELINKTVREVEKNELLFNFIKHCIEILNQCSEKTNNFILFFIVHLSKYLGFAPSKNFNSYNTIFDIRSGLFTPQGTETAYCMTPEESYLFNEILNSEIVKFSLLKIKQDIRHQLIEKILFYYEIHIEGFKGLNSLKVFREIFKNEIIQNNSSGQLL